MAILRHRLPGGWLQSIQDRLQGPQVPVAHDFPERLLDFQKRCRRPSRGHAWLPATDAARALAHAGMRIVHDVAGRQASMQRLRHIQPVDGEADHGSLLLPCK